MEKLRFHRTASAKRRSVHLTAMRILLVLFTYLVVITIPKLELMISLIGSFSSSLLALVMPPALEIVHLWPDRHSIRLFWLTVVAKHCIFITVGLITFVGGTTATVTQLILEFRPPSVAPSSA
ncbi:unnamed protein product [Dicrocoelium dendriticum]|nr:unnamed protein product [Dicrocoelium dendriticum]